MASVFCKEVPLKYIRTPEKRLIQLLIVLIIKPLIWMIITTAKYLPRLNCGQMFEQSA